MNSSILVATALNMLWLLIPIVLIIIFFKARTFKGILGELMVKFAAKLRLSSSTYHRLHNVTLPTANGSTQIDHVFISRFGIFVVETKNMQGQIYGGARQVQWTQQLAKASYTFQNPLRQNYKHTLELESVLDVSADAIHSVIAFVGQSSFHSPMPANVTHGMGYISYIKSFREEVFSLDDVQDILAQLQSARLAQSLATNRRHVKQLRKNLRQSAKTKCPECGGGMVIRTAQRGEHAGQQFFGCLAYPRCRAVRNIK